MRSYEEALNLIGKLSKEMAKLDEDRMEWQRSGLHAADRAEQLSRLDALLRLREKERMNVLQDLVQFPPHHLQYAALLEHFNEAIGVGYDQRVFIMTKYPDGADPK